MLRRTSYALAVFAGFVWLHAAAPQDPPPQQRPVIRADAHFVRVDAYPTSKDGKLIEGLTAKDFEIRENGDVQTVDSVEFVTYPTWTPEANRRDPNSQRESFERAADPTYRVFVIYVNRLQWSNAHYIRQPLIDLLDRTLGPRDLYGVLLPRQAPSDLVLGQLTTTTRDQLTQWLAIFDHWDPAELEPIEHEILSCGGGTGNVAKYRVDDLYRDLEGLVTLLGTIREARTNVIFVTEGLSTPPPVTPIPGSWDTRRGGPGVPPGGLLPPPRGRGSFQPVGELTSQRCEQIQRGMAGKDPLDRFQELLRNARRANVGFYPVNPAGLVAAADYRVTQQAEIQNDLLRTMADETDGLAIVNSNDLAKGVRRVADDLSSHYVLGYYTSNTNWNGATRRIEVRLKPSGDRIRARREYRAPNAKEMKTVAAAIEAPKPVRVPTGIERAIADLQASLRREELTGRAADAKRPEAPARWIGAVVTYRAASPPAAPWVATTDMRFQRTERLKAEWAEGLWPESTAIQISARLFNASSRPMPLEPQVTRTSGPASAVSVSLALAPLAAGDYVIEVTAEAGGQTEHRLLAFRVRLPDSLRPSSRRHQGITDVASGHANDFDPG